VIVPDASELEAVMRYHERSKYHFNRYAAGPEEEPVSSAYESLYARCA
jgi:hypothetical protein